jgi:hypothetical protein
MKLALVLGAGATLAHARHLRSEGHSGDLPPLDNTCAAVTRSAKTGHSARSGWNAVPRERLTPAVATATPAGGALVVPAHGRPSRGRVLATATM